MRDAKDGSVLLIEHGTREGESANAIRLAQSQRDPRVEVLAQAVALALSEAAHSQPPAHVPARAKGELHMAVQHHLGQTVDRHQSERLARQSTPTHQLGGEGELFCEQLEAGEVARIRSVWAEARHHVGSLEAAGGRKRP